MSREIYLFSLSSHPEAHSVSSLDITYYRPSIDFSLYDAFILTSKQAVKALEHYHDKKTFLVKPALCVSKATAAAWEAFGGSVLDVGRGYGDSLEERIESYPQTMRWLYLRAKTIASDFAGKLRAKGFSIDEKIVYKSECSEAIKKTHPPENAILIFTSPSSVDCFLQTHTVLPTHTCIVIGKTTAKALPKNVTPLLASEPTIENCLAIAKSYRLKENSSNSFV